jgi:hypothetical protein
MFVVSNLLLQFFDVVDVVLMIIFELHMFNRYAHILLFGTIGNEELRIPHILDVILYCRECISLRFQWYDDNIAASFTQEYLCTGKSICRLTCGEDSISAETFIQSFNL